MTKQTGFTLIELIMVIVILGVLSAFALPRFADLSGNAETAAMVGARASAKSSSAILHAVALSTDQTGAVGEVWMEGSTYATVWGYPDAGGFGLVTGTTANGFDLAQAATLDDYAIIYETAAANIYNSVNTVAVQADAPSVMITSSPATVGNPCFIYTQATSASSAPTFSDMAALANPSTTVYSCP